MAKYWCIECQEEQEHRESYCHSRCGNDCNAICSKCNTESLTTTLSESKVGDIEEAAIKWAIGKAQREAKLTGRNGSIEIPVARPGTNGAYEFHIVVYNTETNRAYMVRPT